VISNTPYSYESEIAERVISHIWSVFPAPRRLHLADRVSQFSGPLGARIACSGWRPSHVCIYRERHTMPPGHLIDQMANPYDGGMADYCALVFTRPHRWRTECLWLPPGPQSPPAKLAISKGETRAA
jgi:hypothetical protein